MKILNLYSGIGGNRKLWGNEHEITAIEYDEPTAEFYKSQFVNDEVVVTDAHEYLLDNFYKYDFIWSSPPCPTHSRINTTMVGNGHSPTYPDMKLYQEIILLKQWFKGKWVVENVVPYYDLLIPAKKLDRHLWWSNFNISNFNPGEKPKIEFATVKDLEAFYGFEMGNIKKDKNSKLKMLRNCVYPPVGLHILNCALGVINRQNTQQTEIFDFINETHNTL